MNKEHPTVEVEAVALEPCPFCGVDVSLFDGDTIRHPANDCILATDYFDLAKWNTRSTLSTKESDLRAENERLRSALATAEAAMSEYYRYFTGGETRGSYDGKPERRDLWKAMYSARAALQGSAL